MISEPEMVPEGHFGAAELPGPRLSFDDSVAQGGAPARPHASRPAWVWALGGAAAASAVWAGGLYAYGFADPDLGGYRTSGNLCVDAELRTLSAAIGEREGGEGRGSGWGSRRGGLDDAVCFTSLHPDGYELPVDEEGNEMGSLPQVTVGYTLHRKTDPGPEFEGSVAARHAEAGEEESRLRRVDGLGEQAFVVRDESGSDVFLHVLDGQAVLTISVNSSWDVSSGEPMADLSEVEPVMAEDMRALMAKLKS